MLKAPFPYFGGKSGACAAVWAALGNVKNYVEPFCGSAAMLLGRPEIGHTETINDADGYVANFWRAIASDPETVAQIADWPVNEADLFARHSWLVGRSGELLGKLHDDPEYYDPVVAGWWVWGACAWIGSGWCSGNGPWVKYDGHLVDRRKLPHLGDAGRGVNRQLPHLGNAGRGVNRQLPHLGNAGRGVNRQAAGTVGDWFVALSERLRRVRVACGDWQRVLTPVCTTRHGLTGVFLDPPYTVGAMDYAAGGVGGAVAEQVRAWCLMNGGDPLLRIVLCGHAGEHAILERCGWRAVPWAARTGYAKTAGAKANTKSETLWLSPGCLS